MNGKTMRLIKRLTGKGWGTDKELKREWNATPRPERSILRKKYEAQLRAMKE